MEDLFLTAEIGPRTICLSSLARKSYIEAGGKGLGGDYGYFLYEFETANPQAGIQIIAKLASDEAAFRLFDLLTTRHQVAA